MRADDPPESRRVLGAIFGDQQVHDSAYDIHRKAMALAEAERFEFLANRVLPGPDHETFRLAAGFSPTHPAPLVRDSDDESRTAEANRTGSTRVPTGGNLVSPALDLIECAGKLDRLPELRNRIAQSTVSGELQQRCRLAMLGLVDVALNDFDAALVSFDELFARVADRTDESFAGRWPETLAIHECTQHRQTRGAAAELLNQMLQSQVRSAGAPGPDAWSRWVTASAGLLRSSLLDEAADGDGDNGLDRMNATMTNWAPVSRTTAWSRGQGLPCAVWRHSPGMVENLASHDEDYLYYRLPLRGDFQVECDVTSFGWRDSHLMIAGTWVAPIYDHESYGVGSIRGERPDGTIDPRLSECGEWIHYRAVVRDSQCSTYFNGRLVHVEPLSPEHDPWLAVRSAWYADGAVRNLSVRGAPIIPDQVRLTVNSDLAGWHAYQGEPVGGDAGYWQHLGNPEQGGELFGQRESWLSDAAVERLLQYQRPMLEDGTIEYEFFYRDEDVHVHPALDRRAFILNPGGVSTHWVTDGIFDRTGMLPSQQVDVPKVDPADSEAELLPLRNNSWNQVRLTLTGNQLDLFLNDKSVHSVQIESTNQRTFGLFHWADQSEARVRNVVWTGEWPKKLPAVESQDLARDEYHFLDERLGELSAQFYHDFAREGLAEELFATRGGSTEANFEPGAGVRLIVTSSSDSASGWLSPKLRLHGDFDVRVEFDRLETSGPMDSSCGIFLTSISDDPEFTHAGVYRGTLRRPGVADRQVMQSEFNRTTPNGTVLSWHGATSEEATSGTLRLARRGNQMYCLFAEGDSAVFRHVHTEPVPTEPTIVDGLRMMAATYSIMDGDCETAVTWKRLSIQAEEITDLP